MFAGFGGGVGAGGYDRVNSGLREFGELLLGLVRAFCGGAGFLDGNEVGVAQSQKAKPLSAAGGLFLGAAAARENLLDEFVRARDYVYGNQLAYAAGGCG